MVRVYSTNPYQLDKPINYVAQEEEQGDSVQIQEISVHSGRTWSVIQFSRQVKEFILNRIQRIRENSETNERDLLVPNERTFNWCPNPKVVATTTVGLLILSGFVLTIYGMFCVFEGGAPCTRDSKNFEKAQSNGATIAIVGAAILFFSVKLLDMKLIND